MIIGYAKVSSIDQNEARQIMSEVYRILREEKDK